MDKKITFNSPAEYFEEAFPVGNGFVGAMFYGKSKMSINLDSLWSGTGAWKGKKNGAAAMPGIVELVKNGKIIEASRELKKYIFGYDTEAYVPLGDFLCEGQKIDEKYHRELDMASGVITAGYTENGSNVSDLCYC